MKNSITNTKILSSTRINWRVFAFVSFLVLLFAYIIEKNISLPSSVILFLGLLFLISIFFYSLKKPEISLYILAVYIPFSRILVGSFGERITALNFTNILMIIAFISWFINSLTKSQKIYNRSSLDIPLIVFILFGCFSLIRGTLYFGSSYAMAFIIPLKRWLTPILLYFLFFNMVKDKRVLKNLVIIIIFSLTVVALMAIKDYMDVGEVSSLDKARIGGIAEQPNMLAAFFTYYMFIIAAFLLVYYKSWKYWFLALPFLACLRGIMVTFSRGGYVAFAAGLLALAYFRNKIIFILVTILLIFAIFNPMILPAGIRNRMVSTFDTEQIYVTSAEDIVDNSAAQRLEIWKGGIAMIKEYPLLGIGYGVFPSVIPYYAPVKPIDAHNTYILLAAEMGIFGLLLFLWVIAVVFKNSLKLYKRTKDKFFKALALGMLAGIFALLVSNIFGGRLDSQEVGGYFWIISALIFRALYIERNNRKVSSLKSQGSC